MYYIHITTTDGTGDRELTRDSAEDVFDELSGYITVPEEFKTSTITVTDLRASAEVYVWSECTGVTINKLEIE